MRIEHDDTGRRGALRCMAWAGTAMIWTVVAGVPRSTLLGGGGARAQTSGLTFGQLSDSHIGFNKPVNTDVAATLAEGVRAVTAAPEAPAFLIHTGDITHLSRPAEFDTAAQIIGTSRLDTHFVPGEHDILENDGRSFLDRHGKGTQGAGWYSFDAQGVHFVGLVNVVDLKGGGLGNLGAAQLDWLRRDLADRTASTPIVVFAHIPLWTVYADWGWGTEDGAQALALLARFGSVTVLNGHIHQVMQKVEGNVAFHTARSTAFPQPAPGTAPSPGPMAVPPGRLRSVLGTTNVKLVRTDAPLAVVDSTLAG
jgi:3',5'-cyclic AMP phosphodiesterase CpdA